MNCQRDLTNRSCKRVPINKLSKINKIIAITSGKGGVGKSAVTSLMAVSLFKLGYRIGILDCDLYNPSITSIFGLNEGNMSEDINYPDLSNSGIKILSMGLLANQEQPLLWRGTPSCTILKEFWQTIIWGELDFLLLDLPNNSDLQLMSFQEFPLDGVVFVTTPQKHTIQATKHIYKVTKSCKVNVLGTVVNLNSFNCPVCNANLGLRDKLLTKRLKDISELPILEVLPFDLSFLSLCEEGKIELANSGVFQSIPSFFSSKTRFC